MKNLLKNNLLLICLTVLITCLYSCNKLKVTPVLSNGWDALGDLNADSGLGPLAVDDKNYAYVGGHFTGQPDAYHVEKWNGVTWTQVGSLGANATITCLAVYGNAIYASVDSTPAVPGFVSEWDGSSWTKLKDTLTGRIAGGHISSMAVAGDGKVYVVVNNNEIDAWDGYRWKNITGADTLFVNSNMFALTSDFGSYVYTGICARGTGAYPGVALWNGSSLSLVGSYVPNNDILALAIGNLGSVYSAGKFTNKQKQPFIAAWDGANWSELGGANSMNAPGDILCMTTDFGGSVYAGGYLQDGSGNYYVSKWTGHSWTKLNTGVSLNSPITSLAVDKGGNIYAVTYNKSTKKNFLAIYQQ